MIIQQGALNTTALIVPDLIVQLLAPDVSLLNGVPSNIVGVVGSASWGPINSPVSVGNMADYASKFGPIVARKFDMGTVIAAAVLQGANNFRCVRVTDGSDVAASVVVQTSCVTFTAKYSGSLGNSVRVKLEAGSAASSFKATVSLPGAVPEVFDNIVGSGNALWVALAAAINNGNSNLRGPSQIITATAGAGTAAPTLTTLSLASGADGAASVAASTLIGSDTSPRTGMYALRNTGASIGVLADCDDSTQWTTEVTFGLAEGMYMLLVGPSGETIASAASAKASAGIDSYAAKVLLGDWCYFNDSVNGQVRLISPQGFIAGMLANLSPEQSGLNKPIYGIVGTQKSQANQVYSAADLQSLGAACIDAIANPAPGGRYFASRFGRNSSSSVVIHGDNYTRLTNYIASTLNAGLGLFIGKLQSAPERRRAKGTLESFLAAMEAQGQIGNADGTVPFSVQLDSNNNPQDQVAKGVMQANVRVQFLSVIENFIVNLMGGQSVTISRNTQAVA